MTNDSRKEIKNILENVIDWAKKCLEVLRFQKAWKQGHVPEAELASPIRTTEEEQKLVEEIFNPKVSLTDRSKSASGFDISSIKIEVFGPRAKSKNAEKRPAPDIPMTPVEIPAVSLLPADAPSPSPATVSPGSPSRTGAPQTPAIPPMTVNQTPEVEDASPQPKLLVIDDYEPLLNMLARSLKAAGYEPICARDGVEGIVKLHDQQVDLIISDVQMPKIDGFDLSKMLNVRAETRDIPVIFLTEILDIQTRTIAKRLGAADIIIKPFTMDSLLESVKTVLASQLAIRGESVESAPEEAPAVAAN